MESLIFHDGLGREEKAGAEDSFHCFVEVAGKERKGSFSREHPILARSAIGAQGTQRNLP